MKKNKIMQKAFPVVNPGFPPLHEYTMFINLKHLDMAMLRKYCMIKI